MRTTFFLALFIAVASGAALLFGGAGFGPAGQSAPATFLSEVKKLLASDGQVDDFFGVSVALSGDTAIVGAVQDFTGEPGAAYVFERNKGGAGNWGEVKKLMASDAQVQDQFGGSVAISGDTAIVGKAFGDAAYLFERDEGGAGNWGEVKKLTASDARGSAEFGISVSVSGNTAVVGAWMDEGPELNGRNNRYAGFQSNWAGAAYVFERDEGGAGNWGEVKKLTASDAEDFDIFGWSVAVSGDTAVVGAIWEDAAGNQAGAAYIFARDEGGAGNWGEVKKLLASDGEGPDEFGQSVAASGDTVVVGASGADVGGLPAGAAYVFERDEGGADNWGEVKKITASDAQSSDEFGGNPEETKVSSRSVAVAGDTVVVGAWQETTEGLEAGAAYMFKRDEGGAGNWGEVEKVTASDAESRDRFGTSVAVSDGTSIVGAYREDAAGSNAGAAYVFQEPAPKPPDGDTDGDTIVNGDDPNDDNDGCTDVQELGPSATLGGERNPHNFWDFYDVPAGTPLERDQMGNIIDIAAIVLRFGTVSSPPPTEEEAFAEALTLPPDVTSYHAAYDRGGPIPGQDLWDLRPPDGAINIIDIGAAIVQFGHTCA